MATLIIGANGSSPLTIQCQRAGKSQPRFVGSVTPSFQGALRSTVRGQAKVIPILASYVDTATEATIQAAVMNGVQIACSGDILGNIQTQCSFENVVSNMIPGLPGFFEMSFTLNEVQASVTLLRYAPGDTITGEAFTRSTTATYYDVFGVLQSAAINAKRDGHYQFISGTRSLLLEDTRQNVCLQSANFGLTWAAVATPTRVAGAHTSAGISLDLLGDDNAGAAEGYSQTLPFTGNAVKAISIFVKQGSSTSSLIHLVDTTASATRLLAAITWSGSVPVITMTTGTFEGYDALANGVYRLRFVTAAVTAANTNSLILYPANIAAGDITRTGDIYAGGVQAENAAFCSSYIPTTTVAVTRGADSYSLPFTTPPQESTFYIKFVEGGTLYTGTSSGLIGVGASGNPSIFVYNNGGLLTLEHRQGVVGFAVSNAGSAPALGQVDEVRAVLFGDGSVQLGQGIASAAEVNAAQSVANPLATAWNDQLFTLNSRGAGTVGFTAIQSLKIVAGCRSLVEMRAA